MYNNQQTAFPVDRPLLQPVQYDPNRPPFVPNIRVAQDLMPYLPYITGLMMDVITKGIQGPVSMHFYNHMVQGNPQNMQFNPWVNEDFVKEVNNCADFIYLKIATLGNVDIGQAIIRLAPAYISLRSIYEVKLYGALWGYIDAMDQPGIQQQHYQFEQEMAQITALRNGGPIGGTAVPVGAPMMSGRAPAYPQPVGPQMGGYPQAMGAPMAAPMNTGYPVGGAPMAGRTAGAGRDYGTTAPTPVAPQPVAAAPQQVQTAQPVQTAAPAQTEPTLVEAANTTWKPSEQMPYPIAYNPVTTKMYYQIENGKTIPVPAKSNIDMINYDRHNITSLFGHVPDNLPVVKDNGEITRNLVKAVQDASEEAGNTDAQNERVQETMGLKAIVTTSSLETAIQDVRTEMLLKIDRANPPMIFQGYAQVYTPIIGEESEYDFLRKLADSSSYIELREKIRAAGSTASPELLTEVILRCTELMNTLLHKQLSIMPSELTVDDFVQDLDPLLNLLKSNYGEKVQKAFLTNQNMRIKQLFDFPDTSTEAGKSVHDALVENALSSHWDEREDRPAFTFFGPVVRLTYLNVLSHDLLLAGISKVGNILTKQQLPALFDLAHQVFTADDNGLLVARQLVITKDGRIVELHEALLVQGGYLVSLVK